MKRLFILAVLVLIAMPLAAQMGGGIMPGMPGTPSFTMPAGMDLPVAGDGTVFISRNVPGGGVDLVAIRPSGVDGWTYREQAALTSIEVNDTSVLVTWTELSGSIQNVSVKSHLVTLSLASGAVLGKLDYDGTIGKITPFKDGFYALRLIPTGTSPSPSPRPGLMLLARKLVSIDNAGKERWIVSLD